MGIVLLLLSNKQGVAFILIFIKEFYIACGNTNNSVFAIVSMMSDHDCSLKFVQTVAVKKNVCCCKCDMKSNK